MLDQLRTWLAANPRWTLILLVGAALGPFLAKPFNLDDPLFLWLAQQIQAHPGNPFGFEVNWYGRVAPMWAVTENPPLAGYYFALFGSTLGWSEISLHLGGWLAALAVILGTYRLAWRLSGQPLLAACAALFTPLFLVSAGTVMCDVLMLSFWVWALVFWVEGVEQDRFLKILFASLLVALAMMTKYFGVALLPLLAVHGAMARRKAGTWLVGLLLPLAALGAYQWLTLRLYGHPLLSAAVGFATSVQSELGFSKLSSGLIALAFTGGGAASALFLAPALWRARALATIVAATTLFGGALGCSASFFQKYHALENPAARTAVCLQVLFWAIGGTLVLALATADILRHPRDSRSWLLALWVAGTFCFAAFVNWTVNGRSLLPLAPAVGILIARRWEYTGQKHPRILHIGLAVSAGLALLVAQSDFQLAVAVRHSAQEAFVRFDHGQRAIWFEGHWGFQYYLEKLGATAVDFKHPKQLPGDILVVPKNNTDVTEAAPEIVARREVLDIANPSWLTTWHAGVGAGFYASVVGPLPFAFGQAPAERVFVYELKAAAPDAAK